MYKRAQMGIGYLPQEASVFRKLSVEDNISAVLEMTKLSRKEQKAKLESLLNEFRLQHVRKSPGDVLSGGERRRTEIARALAVDPKFILLDEPFAGIDPIAVEDIQSIVAKLKFRNIGILITDHNVTETLSICDRAYLLIEGKIFKHGSAEELAVDEEVKRLYLGRNFELKRKDWLLTGHTPEQDKKLSDYIQWMIESIDHILDNHEHRPDDTSGETITDPELFKEFRNAYYDVIHAMEKAPVYQQQPKLQEYINELKALQIEHKPVTPLDILDESNEEANAGPSYSKPQFLDALLQAKAIFEKCKLIVDNPEFANVLS
jgi:lipopolysaccharide export system ATP-binding protein